jgi:hypothetical protein
MADKKLRIPRKLKIETHIQLKIRTDMTSDARYESTVQTSLISLHVRKSCESENINNILMNIIIFFF